ncbi:head decoration protein [Kitasatospora sp. NPDC127111]|uniref:head decoration protein n=1 Tax=Kitasatospora sp. NPDC127111 TaxID=3345363 RepID=UPI003631594C
MDISITNDSYTQDRRDWLGSAHGTDAPRSIQLDLTKGFVSGTHYPKGFLKSGLPLGKVSASGKYGLYDNAATDGREVLVGFLFTPVDVRTGGSTSPAANILLHCFIAESRLPVAVDSAGKADVAGRIIFV